MPLDTRDPLVKATKSAAHRREIEAAVAAERERCAKIAERHAEYLHLPVPFSGTLTFRVSQEIAARIRNPDSHDNL